jgi:hypothetical protein
MAIGYSASCELRAQPGPAASDLSVVPFGQVQSEGAAAEVT